MKNKKIINQKVIENIYWKDKLSLREIAEIFDISTETIRRWMIKYNIPRRNFSEALKIVANKNEHWKGGENVKYMIESNTIKFKSVWNEDLAYVLGTIDGDGWASGGTIGLESKDKVFILKFCSALKRLGLNSNHKFRKDHMRYTLWASSIRFVNWYKSLSDEVKFKKLVFHNLVWTYIEGRYDSDGSLHPSGMPRISCTKKQGRRFLSKLLSHLGIKHSVSNRANIIRVLKENRKEFFSNVNTCIKRRSPSG